MSEANGQATTDTARLHRFSALQAYTRELPRMSCPPQLSHNLGATHAGVRQMEDVLGYKLTLTYQDYKQCYLRYEYCATPRQHVPRRDLGASANVQETDEVDRGYPPLRRRGVAWWTDSTSMISSRDWTSRRTLATLRFF